MIRHVAHIVWGFRLGGIETMLVNIMNEQVCHISVTLIIINDIVDEGLIASINKRVNIVRLNRQIGSRNPIPHLRLNATLLAKKPDVIHCHTHTIIKLLPKLFHKRSILTVHTTIRDKHLCTQDLRKYARIVAISPSVQQMLQKEFDMDSTVIYNGIDFSKFEHKTDFSQLKPFRIVQVGRLIAPKGHKTLLQAIAQLRELNIHLDIIGDGELREELEEMISQTGLTDRITLLGAKSQDYIFAHLKDYDLLIQPSVWEGFGLTAVEAMAAKVPVLASNIDGLGEILQNGKYGECFESGNVEQCRDKIIELYNAPYKAERLDAIYDYANANFNVKHTANRYLDLYAKI